MRQSRKKVIAALKRLGERDPDRQIRFELGKGGVATPEFEAAELAALLESGDRLGEACLEVMLAKARLYSAMDIGIDLAQLIDNDWRWKYETP